MPKSKISLAKSVKTIKKSIKKMIKKEPVKTKSKLVAAKSKSSNSKKSLESKKPIAKGLSLSKLKNQKVEAFKKLDKQDDGFHKSPMRGSKKSFGK